MTTSENLDDLASVTALADGLRRAAYLRVADAGGDPVGRDEVAETLGVGRTLAAFHLDKLVDVGLLEVSYQRRSGRTGPGAGRPAKMYRISPAEHTVSVPPRSYRDAAEMLAETIERTGAEQTLYEVAREQGRTRSADLTALGYSPTDEGDRTVLRNCPFHQLAEQFPPLICGMNLAMLEGLLEGSEWTARMDPAPGRCCVTLSKIKTD